MSTLPDHLKHLASLTIDDLHVVSTRVGDVVVETDFRPVGMYAGKYETTVYSDEDHDGWRCWYDTRAEAEAGHAAVVKALREGRDPETAVRS